VGDYVPMFSTPIFIGKVFKDISPIIDECKKQQNLCKNGRTLSNRGGWQSKDITNKLLDDYILKQLNEASSLWGFKNKIKIYNFWFNVNKSGDYNIPHFHTNSLLSGVLYLKCPEGSGRIIFENPIFPLLESYINEIPRSQTPVSSYHFTFTPKKSSLLIFPSWVRHHVESGNFEGERISVSFNAFI